MRLAMSIALFMCILFITACNNKPMGVPVDSTPNKSKDLFVSYDKGNYWIYKNSIVDKTGKLVRTIQDSSIVVADTTVMKMTASKVMTYSTPGLISTLSLHHSDNDKLQLFSNVFTDEVPFKLPSSLLIPNSKWHIVCDKTKQSWTLDSLYIKDVEIPNFPTKVDMILEVKASNHGKVTLQTPFGSTECYKVVQDLVVSGKVSFLKIPILKRRSEYYYADKIGLVKMIKEAATISIPNLGDFELNRIEKDLLRYNFTN